MSVPVRLVGGFAALLAAGVGAARRDGTTIEPALLAEVTRFVDLAAGRRTSEPTSSEDPSEHPVGIMDPVSTATAADRLNCSPRWVVDLVASGQLFGVKRGGRWFVDSESVAALLERKAAA